MKVISNSHYDSHEALLMLVKESYAAWTEQLVRDELALKEAREKQRAWKAQPWYKRWFSFIEPDSEWQRMDVYLTKKKIAWIEKVDERASYELTVQHPLHVEGQSMRAKAGHGQEVKDLIAEFRMERNMQTHHIIAEVASKKTDPQRVKCDTRMAEIKAQLSEITTGELDQRIS